MPGHDAKAPKPAPATASERPPAAVPAGTPTDERFAAETAHHDVTDPTHAPGHAPTPDAADTGSVETETVDSMAREERVRLKAYELWEQAGRPDGRADDHWAEAENLIAP